MALYGRRAETALRTFNHFAQRTLEPQRRDGWRRLWVVAQHTVRAKLSNLLGLAALAVRVQATHHGTDGQRTSTQHATGNGTRAAVRRLALLLVLMRVLCWLIIVGRRVVLAVLVMAILTWALALVGSRALVLSTAVALVVALVVVMVLRLSGTRRLGARYANRGAASRRRTAG